MANNFVLPSATQSIAIARLNWNDSLRAAASHFFSAAAPTSLNYTDEGTSVNPIPDGILFVSDVTGAVYKQDSSRKKDSPVHGGNWTRNGVGLRTEDSLAAADFSTYEIGEPFVTVPSNARMYVKSSNAGAITDVGLPQASSITTTMLQDSAVTTAKINNDAVTLDKLNNQIQGDILFYGVSGNPSTLPAGNAGFVLSTAGAGANPVWKRSGLSNITVFSTAGNHTWVRPQTVGFVKVTCIAGGGGGGEATPGGPGGAGGTAIKLIDVSASDNVSVTVGAGGAHANNTDGFPGGESSFGNFISAEGGTGGEEGSSGGRGGGGGGATGGDINLAGGDGGEGTQHATGGESSLSGRARPGANGKFPGGGAGGETGSTVGARGIVIVEEF